VIRSPKLALPGASPPQTKALGDLQVRTARLADAEASYAAALALYRQVEARLGEANTLQALGRFFSASGADDQAEAAFAAALADFEANGDRYSAAVTLTYRGQHRLARRQDSGPLDWRNALDLAATVDQYLLGQVMAITLGDACRLLASCEADDYLGAALPGLVNADDPASLPLSEAQRGIHAVALAGFALVHDLAAIKAAGLPPGDLDRSRLLDAARQLDEATGSAFGLAALTQETLGLISALVGSQPLVSLAAAWVQTRTWEESETFLNEHHGELLSTDGHAAMAALATANPGNETLALHVNLLNAAQQEGIGTAYSLLRAELAVARSEAILQGWLDCAPDWAASAAHLAAHASELTDPVTVAALAAACEREPGDARLWLHLGLLLMGDQAAGGYSTAKTGNPDPFQRAGELLADGDLDHARAWASIAWAHDGGRGALLMGRVQLKRGEPDQAANALATTTTEVTREQLADLLTAYDDLLSAQPGEPWRHAEHAEALQRADRPEEAIAAHDRAITLAPDNASLHFNKGHLLVGLGRFEEAIPELLDVTRLRPDDVLGARVLLGAIAWPADAQEAREHFAAALTSPGTRLTPFTRAFYRAIALAGLGRPDEAIAELEAAIAARPASEVPFDETDRRLLERFGEPPLAGLDALRELLEAKASAGMATQGGANGNLRPAGSAVPEPS
jgi:tetratricopeptide (TPR) repeat protein